jgi:hypothetical protein
VRKTATLKKDVDRKLSTDNHSTQGKSSEYRESGVFAAAVRGSNPNCGFSFALDP